MGYIKENFELEKLKMKAKVSQTLKNLEELSVEEIRSTYQEVLMFAQKLPAKERSAFFWLSNLEMLSMIVEGFQEMGTMTLEERWCKANAEYEELKKWANAESAKVTMELKQTGKYKHGLDTNSEAYAPVHEEYKRQTLALFDKYDLPNKPEL